MSEVFKKHLLVVVSLRLVHVEVFTVEVEEAVRKFVARKRSNDQLTVKSVKHAATRHVASALLGVILWLNCFFIRFICRLNLSDGIRILLFGRLGHSCNCVGLCIKGLGCICVEF